jgi:hypothetical protein
MDDTLTRFRYCGIALVEGAIVGYLTAAAWFIAGGF